jgi:hypothetical protein
MVAGGPVGAGNQQIHVASGIAMFYYFQGLGREMTLSNVPLCLLKLKDEYADTILGFANLEGARSCSNFGDGVSG